MNKKGTWEVLPILGVVIFLVMVYFIFVDTSKIDVFKKGSECERTTLEDISILCHNRSRIVNNRMFEEYGCTLINDVRGSEYGCAADWYLTEVGWKGYEMIVCNGDLDNCYDSLLIGLSEDTKEELLGRVEINE